MVVVVAPDVLPLVPLVSHLLTVPSVSLATISPATTALVVLLSSLAVYSALLLSVSPADSPVDSSSIRVPVVVPTAQMPFPSVSDVLPPLLALAVPTVSPSTTQSVLPALLSSPTARLALTLLVILVLLVTILMEPLPVWPAVKAVILALLQVTVPSVSVSTGWMVPSLVLSVPQS